MIHDCHVCQRSLGRNNVVSRMPVGRRLAFDAARGRLWVVCPRCSEWNLTPIEERWEAIEECERLFATAEARASTPHVGLARTGSIELLRIGSALRDEIANWRYGPRLRRRKRRTSAVGAGAGVVAGGAVGGAVIAGLTTGSLVVGGWLLAIAAAWGATLARSGGPIRGARFSFIDHSGKVVRLPQAAVEWIRLTRRRGGPWGTVIGAFIVAEGIDLRYEGDASLPLLGAALPRLNWRGASPQELVRATRIVDDAEDHRSADENEPGAPQQSWRRIVIGHWPAKDALDSMNIVPRLALEMAVAEEMERRAVVGKAAELEAQWAGAEEVAGIADNLLLPRAVSEWLARLQRGRDGGKR